MSFIREKDDTKLKTTPLNLSKRKLCNYPYPF